MSEYDSGNPKHVGIARRFARVEDQTREQFVVHVMGMPSGRQYFHDQFIRFVLADPFAATPERTAYNCGQLNVCQRVLADIVRICPDNYIVMMREANARDAANEQRRARSNEDANGRDPGPIPDYVHPAFDDAPAVGDDKVSRDFHGHEGEDQ